MLHIILGILKFIGILLAVLILLILFVAAVVLLVPVRYQARIVKTEQEAGAQGKVTWLLHLISVAASYDLLKKEQKLEIRICGISLDSIKGILKKRKEKKEQKAVAKERREAEKSKGSAEEAYEDGFEEELLSFDLADDESVQKSEEKSSGEVEEDAAGSSVDVDSDASAEEKNKTDDSESKESQVPFYQKLLYKLSGICDKIKGIPEKLRTIITTVLNLIRKIAGIIRGIYNGTVNLYEKLSQIPDRVESVLQMLEEYEVKAVTGDVLQELKYIVKHYGPRKAKGFLHFGTGDPAMTGKLTGLLYMILPAQAGDMEIQPEFTEAVFEADLTIKGRVRIVHGIPVAYRLLRKKRLLRLIKKLLK